MNAPFVIGTSGHIDHGKTALVRALTGIDTDRLKEEKERGITIELGFANLDLSAEGIAEPVGVVDVPGHERFIRTMVAGAVGIDLVVLVVAADEGVMPQTREHLDVCRLLDVRRGVVALTKCDLVPADLRELAIEELRGALLGTFLDGAAIVPCSSVTSEGLAELRRSIADALRAAPAKDPEGLMRLPLDRAFSMKGFGTVVTGTLWSGRISVGDEVVALPGGVVGKVRGVQVHGRSVEIARAGQRTACNVALPLERVARGATLVHPDRFVAGRSLDVRLRYLATSRAPLKRSSRILVHAGTAQMLASVALLDRDELGPGEEALAQLRLDAPIVALPGDRFILRGFALQKEHRTTVGGGVVLRVLGPRHRSAGPEVIADLRAAKSAIDRPLERIELEVRWSGATGIDRAALQMRVPSTPNVTEAALAKLLAAQRIVQFDRERNAYVHRSAIDDLAARIIAAVDRYHLAEPLRPGIPREELRTKVPSMVSAKLVHLVIEELIAAARLAGDRESVRRPAHDAATSDRAKGLAPIGERVAREFRVASLTPPRPSEVAATLTSDEKTVRAAIELLVRSGALIKVQDLYFDRAGVDGLRDRLRAFLRDRGQITPQEWKDLVGASRKFAIPLAEHFDAERVTLRTGDVRKLRG